MLKIRLQRVGRKHEPVFRVVLTESVNSPKSGKFLEILGNYDTRKNNEVSQLKIDRIKYWISKGAKLSGTLNNFLVNKKMIKGEKMNVLSRRTPVKKDAPKESEPAKKPVVEDKKTEVSSESTPKKEGTEVEANK